MAFSQLSTVVLKSEKVALQRRRWRSDPGCCHFRSGWSWLACQWRHRCSWGAEASGQRGGVCHQGDLARCSSLLLPSALLIFPLWLTSALTQSKATQRVFHGLAASPPDASDASFSHTQKSLLFFPHICVILEQIRDLGIVQGDSGVFSVCSVSGKWDESGNVSLHI